MNTTVRNYLIELARTKDKFVFYSELVQDCNLGLDLHTEYGLQQLRNVLGEVSEYENEFGRPMISSLVIYKDPRKNDQGDGFYRLAEKLGKGNAKHLKESMYGFVEAEVCRRYWQNEDNYRKYAGEVSREDNAEGEPEFFTEDELKFFKSWQLQAYDPSNQTHLDAKNLLMSTVWEKTFYLGNRILSELQGFEMEAKKTWSQRGWAERDGQNKQAAIFKHYTWIKVFRTTDRGRDIYFTFGLDAHPETEAFVYKIDCRRTRDSKFTEEQISLFNNLIYPPANWLELSFEELIHLDWNSLIIVCVDFINKYLTLYDALVAAVWGQPIQPTLFKNTLVWRPKPIDGYDNMPEGKRTFKGVDVDFAGKAKEQKDLGDAGEELVKINEIATLNSKGLNSLAVQVRIAKDGEGYDVFSLHEDGSEKFIEVKTTTGDEYAPFYLSENEIAFMQLHPNQYCIYRIFHFDPENNFGECFAITGNIEAQLLMKPTQFKAVLKKD